MKTFKSTSKKRNRKEKIDNEILVKSRERVKQRGEVYTPAALVSKMLDQLPVECWTDPFKTFCDPAGCGTGNFLVEALRRKLERNVLSFDTIVSEIGVLTRAEIALMTIHGIDIASDNVDETKIRLIQIVENWYKNTFGVTCNDDQITLLTQILDSNIVCGDALKHTWKANKFDIMLQKVKWAISCQ